MHDPRPYVLIVDDDQALLDALPETLRLRMPSLQIDTCPAAAEALELIRMRDYDAIVSDIKMPGMDGLALLAAIRAARPETPTLLITGHGEHDLAVQALRGGAYDLIQKPIDREYFVASLGRAIQLRQLEREVAGQKLALERHARVLDHVGDGVFLVDAGGMIQHWNPAAEAITGRKYEAVHDLPAAEVLGGWNNVVPLIPVSDKPGPASEAAAVVPVDIDGRELWLSISGVTFADGTVYAFRNLTEERALEELKGEFVATVSHELRTPLAAIYGSAQTLLRRDVEIDATSKERLLEVIASESERLTRIASDILLANNLDSGRLQLERERVDIGGLVREVDDEMRTLFASRQDISFDVEIPETVNSIPGDGDRLRQVLINLVDNAVKYSPGGGRVGVRVQENDDGLRLAVSDEGLGISHNEQQRIFGKFYRVDPQQTGGVGGTGLGLYISRELVRRMEGRISVTSTEGKGS